MRELAERLRGSPLFRPALVAPIVIMFVFSVFNLTAPPDASRLPAAITIGVVNHDAGLPLIPVKLSEQLLEGLRGSLPFQVREFDADDAARMALANGEVSAVLVLPQDFTANAMGGAPITVRLINSQHLSISETQLTGVMAQQLSAGMSAAISTVRLAAAQGRPPTPELPVTVETETLYSASGPAALAAPFVMVFATWVSGFVGAILFYLVTRPEVAPSTAVRVAALRILAPVVVTLLASLLLTLMVAWTGGLWDRFFAIWGTAWLAAAAVTWLLAGLFALFGIWGIILALPLVFYQSILAGAQLPVAAAPDWLRWLGEAVPFSDLSHAFRSVVIGGPFGTRPWLTFIIAAAVGIVLIAIGTWLHGLVHRGRERPGLA
jgi:uncharacterized phage infection (PIP) family protein YhgE